MSKQLKGMPDQDLLAAPKSSGPLVKIMSGRFRGAWEELTPWLWDISSDEELNQCAEICIRIEDQLFPIVDAEAIERTEEVPLHVLKIMSRIGLFALKVPKKLGGKGLLQPEYNRVLMKLAEKSSALPAYVSAHNSLGAIYPLVHYGTSEQQRRLLPEVMRWPTGFCFTERNVGSDPASMQTYAVRVSNEAGEVVGYKLYGEKWHTTNALRARYLAVVALTVDEPEDVERMQKGELKKCFSVFLVTTNFLGVVIGPQNKFAGMKGIDNANPRFDGAYVPVGNRIGEEGAGFGMALEALNSGRIAVGAIALQAGKDAYHIASQWAEERKQFGGPIGEKQLVGEKLVRMAANLYALKALVELAGGRTAEGLDASVEAAATKVLSTERNWIAVDDAMQIRGGRGYESAETLSRRERDVLPMERIWRDLRVARIFEGSTEVLTLWSCFQGLGPYLEVAEPVLKGKRFFAMFHAGAKFAAWYLGTFFARKATKSVFTLEKRQKSHLRFAERASRKLARKIIVACVRYRGKMVHKQLLHRRLFEIASEILLIAAVVSRSAPLNRLDLDMEWLDAEIEQERELADLYARGARRRVRQLFRELFRNDDDTVYPASKKVMDGTYGNVLL